VAYGGVGWGVGADSRCGWDFPHPCDL
jgi:hypothetical protein